jgi:FlgO protein
LNKVIKEHKLASTGLVSEESKKKLGEILGVDAKVTGTVVNIIESVKTNARLINVENGLVFAVAQESIQKTSLITSLMDAVVYENTANTPAEHKPSLKLTVRVGKYKYELVSSERRITT